MIKLAPSILSADFIRLGEQIKLFEKQKVDYIHIDVMDGLFVPNISMGMPIIKSVSEFTNIPLDVHLMIDKPERYIKEFADNGSDIINIHVEASQDAESCIKEIKSLGKKAGVTIKPNTDYEDILKFIEDIDLLLVMSVEPGFGGQQFIQESLFKVEKIAEYIKKNNYSCELEIDGGINLSNVKSALDAGADVIVAGSAILNASDIGEEIVKYKNIFKEYEV